MTGGRHIRDRRRAKPEASILEREICEQGEALGRYDTDRLVAAAQTLTGPDVSHIVIAGRGSSHNAARFAQYLFGSELRLPVGLAAPWLYRDPERAPRLGHAAVIGISQSGQSPDIVGVLSAARRQGRPTVVITADTDSPLALQADIVVPLRTTESSVAATKTYLGTLMSIVRIVDWTAPDPERHDWIERLPAVVGETAALLLADRAAFDCLADMPLLTVTGRGLAYSAACETALKVRELSGMPAEAFSPPDLMHGPVAALDGRGAVWSIEPDEDVAHVLAQAAVTITVARSDPSPRTGSVHIALPSEAPSWATALLSPIAGQVAGLRLAERLGLDVDRPHGLTKVTRTL